VGPDTGERLMNYVHRWRPLCPPWGCRSRGALTVRR